MILKVSYIEPLSARLWPLVFWPWSQLLPIKSAAPILRVSWRSGNLILMPFWIRCLRVLGYHPYIQNMAIILRHLSLLLGLLELLELLKTLGTLGQATLLVSCIVQ